MKKIAALLLALVMALSLAACGGASAKNIKETDLDGEWVRESDGWPMTIHSGSVEALEAISEHGSKTSINSTFQLEDGVMAFGSKKYNVIVEKGQVTRLENDDYTYVRLSRTQLTMDETFSDNGIADVTITGIDYTRLLDAKTYAPVESGGGWVAGDGMLFMEITYTVKNMYTNALEIPGGVQMTIHYGDGYQFGTEEGKYCYYRELDGTGRYKRGGSLAEGYSIELSPLTEGKYAVYIPVAEVMSTDTESPMTIDLNLESGTSFAYANVKVR